MPYANRFFPDPKPTPRVKEPKVLKKTPRKAAATILNTLPEAIAFADKWFSEYIRLVNSDNDGFARCYTCGELMFWKALQCSHYEDRDWKPTRFDERNGKPGCEDRNVHKGGNKAAYTLKLQQEYGIQIIQTLHDKARSGERLDRLEVLYIGNYYKQKTLELKKMKNLN